MDRAEMAFFVSPFEPDPAHTGGGSGVLGQAQSSNLLQNGSEVDAMNKPILAPSNDTITCGNLPGSKKVYVGDLKVPFREVGLSGGQLDLEPDVL